LSRILASGGDDGPSMPKLRPEGGGRYPSNNSSSNAAVPSPGAGSMGSAHENDYGEMNSPGWPRTPASPVSSKKVRIHNTCSFSLFFILWFIYYIQIVECQCIRVLHVFVCLKYDLIAH
jgi:hypothetical protein